MRYFPYNGGKASESPEQDRYTSPVIVLQTIAANLGRMEAVRAFLSGLMEKNGMLTAVLSSQVISNVPAAVLLSSFTENWKALLLGTNLGGLGTPIASLASLISLKFYLKTEQADLKSYLLLFLSLNAGGLLLLLAAACIL